MSGTMYKNEPIRILQVLATLNRGGAEAMIMNLYRAIDRDRIQFDFVVHQPKQGAFDAEVRNLGGKIYVAQIYKGTNHFEYVRWWKEFFDSHREYLIVHSHIRSTASIILGIAKRKGRITIAHSHSTSSGNGISAIAKNLLQYPIRYKADYFMGCSQLAGEWLFGKKICSSDKYFCLKNAIDAQVFQFNEAMAHNRRAEFGVSRDEFLLGTVGRLSPPKNPLMIIDIADELKNRKFPFKFIWVGTGEMVDAVKETIHDKKMDDVIILTGVRSDINELLMAMDLFLFPSRWEGLPVAAVEAQAAGLPCVMSNAISEEVCITPLVSMLSINESVTVWCDEIAKRVKEGHASTLNMVRESGFDIHESSKWLTEFYVKLIEKRESQTNDLLLEK